MAGSLVFDPVSGSTISPGPVIATWTYDTFPLTALFYVDGVWVANWSIGGSPPAADPTADGGAYYVTVEYPSPTVVFTIAKYGGWNDQSGTVNLQIDTTDAGADTFTGTFTVDPILDPPKLDYAVEGLERMLDQFDGSVNLRLLASSYLDQAQELELAADPLLRRMNVETMVGDRLDGLGQIVNVTRSGRIDRDYRLRIRAELAILLSQGSVEDLIAIIRILIDLEPPPSFQINEYYPKTVYMRPIDLALADDPVVIGTLLKRAVSAATQLWFVYSERDDSETFQLSSQGATVETSSSLGLANVAQSSGGHLAGVV